MNSAHDHGNCELCDLIEKERDQSRAHASQLAAKATAFAEAFRIEFHCAQAEAEHWHGWVDGFNPADAEDAAYLALRDFLRIPVGGRFAWHCAACNSSGDGVLPTRNDKPVCPLCLSTDVGAGDTNPNPSGPACAQVPAVDYPPARQPVGLGPYEARVVEETFGQMSAKVVMADVALEIARELDRRVAGERGTPLLDQRGIAGANTITLESAACPCCGMCHGPGIAPRTASAGHIAHRDDWACPVTLAACDRPRECYPDGCARAKPAR